jgi:hypothetical protein
MPCSICLGHDDYPCKGENFLAKTIKEGKSYLEEEDNDWTWCSRGSSITNFNSFFVIIHYFSGDFRANSHRTGTPDGDRYVRRRGDGYGGHLSEFLLPR